MWCAECVCVCDCDFLCGGVLCGCLGVFSVCLRVTLKMWLCVLFVMYTVVLYGLSLCVVCVFACVVVFDVCYVFVCCVCDCSCDVVWLMCWFVMCCVFNVPVFV